MRAPMSFPPATPNLSNNDIPIDESISLSPLNTPSDNDKWLKYKLVKE